MPSRRGIRPRPIGMHVILICGDVEIPETDDLNEMQEMSIADMPDETDEELSKAGQIAAKLVLAMQNFIEALLETAQPKCRILRTTSSALSGGQAPLIEQMTLFEMVTSK
jgi:hypothetical protein